MSEKRGTPVDSSGTASVPPTAGQHNSVGQLKRLADKVLNRSVPLSQPYTVGQWDSAPVPVQSSGTPVGQQRDSAECSGLEKRLTHHGISIAIDRKTGSALLLFKPSDAELVQDVADVLQPFEAGRLTAVQRKELLASLDYYDSLLARKLEGSLWTKKEER